MKEELIQKCGIQVKKNKKNQRNKMSKGFDVEFELPKGDLEKLLKKYKKLNKYRKSNLFQIMTLDDSEKVISKMLKELEDDPIDG